MLESNSEIIIYQAKDGTTKIDVRLEKETVWLTLNQLAELFQRDKSVISRHIQNIFAEGELFDSATVANYATVQNENKREALTHALLESFKTPHVKKWKSVGYKL